MLLNKRAVRRFIAEENRQCTKDFVERLDIELLNILRRYCAMFGSKKRMQANIFDTIQLRIVFAPEQEKKGKRKAPEPIDLG